MKSINHFMALIFCLFVGTSMLLVASAGATDVTNHYYYSGQGDNLSNYMYMDLDLQDDDTATLTFSTKYDIEETGDFAMAFISYDPNVKQLFGWKLNGTQTDWTTKSYDLSPFSDVLYIGFYYETDDSGTIKDGFYVDNIEITVNGATILDDDGTNTTWKFVRFSREPTTIINQPIDIWIEQDATENITWIVTETSGFYKVLNDSTEVVSSTQYTNGDELQVPINTTTLGTWNYIIIANDTSGNETSDEVKVTVVEKVQPTISITSHNDGDSTTSSSITIRGVVDGTNSTPTVTVNEILAEVILKDGYAGTFSLPVSLTLGDNTINANVTDAAGLKGKRSITVIRNKDDNSDSSSSGGSGGGGGGGTSGEDFKNILISETEREYVNKDSKVSYSFDLEGNIIRYVNFTGKTSSGRIAAKIDILKSTSTLVDHAPPGEVFKNMGIYVGNLGWASPNNIANPTISFIVHKSWVNENKIDKSTINLNRYSDEKWNPLETDLIDEDEDFLYFESKTPGFSQFAVTGIEASVDAQSSEEEVVVEPTVVVERKEPVTEQTPDEKDTGIPGFSLLTGFAIMLVVVQLLRRKK
ncbi:MAG: PGF-pre-PGF domain-containing protein [ANME-2 cluster archaeon]|nr:PGF-pre-PGF domain-containing protein [ANME-2 cluster archaeon]MBC2701466.1 PGF-pre-PGF domain-containing protein [ANME-2 cluster archaeon]MBC2706889.1 PGF-pre-PGF domain-containing protein [ANME-2 cluster archaeon]MBC2746178.1 PGF-pre-PGF domain-containing protein [ANME-2 cluster archaeon]MBC2762841.1 PGF-pre-PGF domain-containing protein [ANME-2 cluster archaeon]